MMPFTFTILTSFIGGFGLVWVFGERLREWGTPRWTDGHRVLIFAFKLLAVLIFLGVIKHYLVGPYTKFPVSAVWALGFGCACGFLFFLVYRQSRTKNVAEDDTSANVNTALNNKTRLTKKTLTWQDWLFLDFDVLKEHFKSDTSKKSGKK